jgi:hypothetical protein
MYLQANDQNLVIPAKQCKAGAFERNFLLDMSLLCSSTAKSTGDFFKAAHGALMSAKINKSLKIVSRRARRSVYCEPQICP